MFLTLICLTRVLNHNLPRMTSFLTLIFLGEVLPLI